MRSALSAAIRAEGGDVRLRGDAGAGERPDGRISAERRRAHGAPPSNLSNPKVNAV